MREEVAPWGDVFQMVAKKGTGSVDKRGGGSVGEVDIDGSVDLLPRPFGIRRNHFSIIFSIFCFKNINSRYQCVFFYIFSPGRQL